MKKKRNQYHNELFCHKMTVTDRELIEFRPHEFNKFMHIKPINNFDIISADIDTLTKLLQESSV